VISVELACKTVCGDWLALLLALFVPLDEDDEDPLEPLSEDVVVVTSIKKY
jgi:hypothetical protein